MDWSIISTIGSSVTILGGLIAASRWMKNSILKSLDSKFASIDNRFDLIDEKFKAVDIRFQHIDERINTLADQIKEIRQDLRQVSSALMINKIIDQAKVEKKL